MQDQTTEIQKPVKRNTITQEMIEDSIKLVQYYVFPGTTQTVCCLTLYNGYNVIGESACVDPANFDTEIGNRIALENAKSKIWALEGYRLCNELYENPPEKPSCNGCACEHGCSLEIEVKPVEPVVEPPVEPKKVELIRVEPPKFPSTGLDGLFERLARAFIRLG